MQEAQETLDPVPNTNFEVYKSQLLARFANPATEHRCAQIAMDGSVKLDQRIVRVIQERLASAQAVPAGTFVLAAWLSYLYSKLAPQQAQSAALIDPNASEFQRLFSESGASLRAFAQCVIDRFPLFEKIRENSDFREKLLQIIDQIQQRGLSAALDDFKA